MVASPITARRSVTLPVLLACLLTAFSPAALADNPIVQTSYTADPAPMVFEGRVYLYTSHDEDVTVNDFFTMNDWRLYSTVDMVNWTDHGSPASYRTFSWGTGDAWAPHGVARNGKFYLYVPLNNSTGAKIGVAVADAPAGPFTDPLGKALISTGSGNIDPTVFVDDDGQAYLYWGNPDLWYVKLNPDMISYSGSPTKTSLTTAGFGTRSNSARATAYEEGPWFYKRGTLYYLVYPADGTPEKISYTTSSSPTGPWTFGGDIMAKQSGAGSSFTNHPGVIDYEGKSYFFYHNGALPGGGGFKRSVCVEEFTYGANGSIPTIQMSSGGPAPVRALNPYQQVEAETIAFSSGLKTEACTDTGGGLNVTSIHAGDYIKVKNVDFLDGAISFDARVSAAASNAKIELHLDSQGGTLLATCDVSGASTWTTKTCALSGGSGKHDLFLKFTGGSGELFKLNWWKLTGTTPPDPTGGAAGAGGHGTGGSAGTSGGTALAGTGGSVDANGGTAGAIAGAGMTSAGAGGTGMGGAVAQPGGTSGGGSGGSGGAVQSAGAGGAAGAGAATMPSGGAGNAGGAAGAGAPSVAPGSGAAASGEAAGCACRVGSRSSDVPAFAALVALGLGLRRRAGRVRLARRGLSDAR